MEQKMITIPFDMELAKKIQAGELPGKIVTRDGKDVRIVCWDRKTKAKYSIVALVDKVDFEDVQNCSEAGESTKSIDCFNLVLQVPEWTQFKDGDVLRANNGVFVLNKKGEYKTSFHIGFFFGKLTYRGAANMDNIDGISYATEEQKQQLIDALKASTDPSAKECLKRFFGIEEKKECEFEFLQPVLVRSSPNYQWLYGNFTHKSGDLHFVSGGIGYEFCIPYNEETKHLLGTTDNWEE